jgi:hypothetical protein
MNPNPAAAETLGNITPCPYCGCPDEFDHTEECPVLPEVVALQRRVKELERVQVEILKALDGTITQCRELAGILNDFALIAQGKPPQHIK